MGKRQTHIFATKHDLVPGLTKIEAELDIRYARCGSYAGGIFEQYSSLPGWDGLGKNTTGGHLDGPQFLVVSRSQKINVEPIHLFVASSGVHKAGTQKATLVDAVGQLSRSTLPLDKALSLLDEMTVEDTHLQKTEDVYAVSQKLNPDSIVFSPGGMYDKLPVLIAGHIGTISQTKGALNLYNQFAKAIIKGFEKIGSYYVGPEAGRLMTKGYRMVTIGIGSPATYDLKRT
jgi:hypothetical protein